MLIPATEANMNRTALALAALTALTLLFLAAVRLLRRRHRGGHLRLGPLPAGLRSLASNVGSLSTFGVGLPVAPRRGLRRLGTLLGLR